MSSPAAAIQNQRKLSIIQERPTPPISAPTRFSRVACRDIDWGLRRRLSDYAVVGSQEAMSVAGRSTKWLLRNNSDPTDLYIAKFADKNGRAETYTELFNNQLGVALGFEMAHSGVVRLDDKLYFVTKSFRDADERLVHGSLMVEELLATTPKDTDAIGKGRDEQHFYSIDFLRDVILQFCPGACGAAVLAKFIEMLVFDALIGSMDRHHQNWGVLQPLAEPARTRLAPIFDSARALMWDFPEGKLAEYDGEETKIHRYVENARPRVGTYPKSTKPKGCNHFELIENLLHLFPHQTRAVLLKIHPDIGDIADTLMQQFPFQRAFSGRRKRLIRRVLEIRTDRLLALAKTGGVYGPAE